MAVNVNPNVQPQPQPAPRPTPEPTPKPTPQPEPEPSLGAIEAPQQPAAPAPASPEALFTPPPVSAALFEPEPEIASNPQSKPVESDRSIEASLRRLSSSPDVRPDAKARAQDALGAIAQSAPPAAPVAPAQREPVTVHKAPPPTEPTQEEIDQATALVDKRLSGTPTGRAESAEAYSSEISEVVSAIVASRVAASTASDAAVKEIEATPEAKAPSSPQPVPPAPRAGVLGRAFTQARKMQSNIAKATFGKWKGTAVSAKLTGDPDVKINEASVSAQVLLRAYLKQTSYLRTLMAGVVDENRMAVDDGYAIVQIIKFFDENIIEGLCEKSPVTTESDAHRRVIRAHDGDGVRIHPIVHAMWNADFDGDTMRVSFDPKAIAGTKSAMDFLVGTDGAGKIDPSFFGMARWGYGERSIGQILDDMFGPESENPLRLTKDEIRGLSDAIEQTYTDVDAGFRSMLMWVRAIGMRSGGQRLEQDNITARVLSDIWHMNTMIRLASLPVTNMINYLGPVIEEAELATSQYEQGLPGQLEHLVVPGTAPSSNYAYSAAVNGPFGFIRGRNAIFRFYAGLAKLSKADPAVESPRSNKSIVTAESHTAQQIAAVTSLEDSGRGLAESARDMVVIAMNGGPDVSSDAAFEKWLNEFARQYNFVAIAVNSALANFGLDGGIVGYESVSMPLIEKSNPTFWRRGVRSQFLKVYGVYTMGKLFKDSCPKGWENVPLAEYVQRNHEAAANLGTSDTTFDTITKFLGRLADMRTSFARTFNNRLMGDKHLKETGLLEDMMADGGRKTKFKEMLERRETAIAKGQPHALDQDLEMLADAFFLISKDVFYFLGLHDPMRFIETRLGRKFVDATNINQLGGALYEAIARFRYEPIRLAELRLKRAVEAHDAAAEQSAEADYEHELNQLASSSDVWSAVVQAYRDGADVFDGVLFSDMTKSGKDDIINKLVRTSPGGHRTHKSFEVAYGLFARPRGEHSGSRFNSDVGHTTLLDHIKDSKNKVKRWSNTNWDVVRDDVIEAKKIHGPKSGDEGRVLRFLKLVASDRATLVQFDPYMVVDAALDMAKSFATSEKSQQEESGSYAYESVGYMVNGGTYSDASVGGDIALGGVSLRQFQESPMLIARVLTDPGFSIEVYDGTGRKTVSMMEIFGTTAPDDGQVWDWLQRHPRAAMALRKTTVRNRINNKTGFSMPVATMSLTETMTDVLFENKAMSQNRRAMKVLANHPGFYAMLNLTSAMTGKKRIQVRDDMIQQVDGVIKLLRGMHAWYGNTFEFVQQVAEAQGLDFEAIEDAYQRGQELEDQGVNLANAPLSDVRFSGDYQRGQLLHRLAEDLEKYGMELESAGFSRTRAADPEDVAKSLFHLGDNETVRGYFDADQKLSASKTSQSTSVNGAMSKLYAGLMILAHHNPDPCDAGDPDPIDVAYFLSNWHEFTGRQARVAPGRWVPVNEVTIHKIVGRAVNNEILIEDPAKCTATLCACKRHATADPSTNFRRNQTSSIGRFLTVVRSLSTEGLNLKTKTVGNDGTDSVTKFEIFDIIENTDMVRAVEDAFTYAEEGRDPMAAARMMLANLIQKTYADMGYSDELTLDDYVNVAQILCRPIVVEGNVSGVHVLMLGQASAIISEAMDRAGEDITWDEFVDIATQALDSPAVFDELDIETIMAGVRVRTFMPYHSSGLTDQRMASTERSTELMYEIASRVKVTPQTDFQLDKAEAELLKKYKDLVVPWKNVAGYVKSWGKNRYTFRISDVFPANEVPKTLSGSIGPRNAWIISAKNPRFADAMVQAFEHGVTIFLADSDPAAGFPASDVWGEIIERTGGMLDQYQGVPTDMPDDGKDYDHRKVAGYFISTFDIRLNGKNSTIRKGAFDAGVFRAPAKQISFFFESVANELGLSDSEFAACASWAKSLTAKTTGTYHMKASVAFAGFIRQMSNPLVEGSQQAPIVRVVPLDEVIENIVDPAFSEDGSVPIDLGIDVEDGSTHHARLSEGLARYSSRLAEVDHDTGLLPSGRPDEIIGWLEASWGDEVRYHPIRLYEEGNESGAPEDFTIKDAVFNNDTQRLEITWEQEHSMDGRLFKLFEDLYSADKFIARARNIPDIELANGVKLSGMIAKASTASRRLFMRRPQLMTTLMYMARMEPFGYNLAEDGKVLIEYPDLKAGLLDGTAQIGAWIDAMTDEDGKYVDIEIIGDDPIMNSFVNQMAQEAIRYSICPTVVFASRHLIADETAPGSGAWTPSNLWFNFQILFDDSQNYQEHLMRLMSRMMPELCPPGLSDTGNTLFNANLQVQVPVAYTSLEGEEVTKYQWVDLYGGFHFLDDHYTGRSNSGATVDTYGIPTLNTMLAGRRLSPDEIKAYRAWGNIAAVDPDAVGPAILSAAEEDDDIDVDGE